MGERSYNSGSRSLRRALRFAAGSIALLIVSSVQSRARAQTPPPALQRYFSSGADLLTVPKVGEPGSAWFSNGAEVTSAQPGTVADWYFSRGAELTTVPKPGQVGAEYYHQGADALSMERWFDVPAMQSPAPPAEQAPAPSEAAPAEAEPSEQPSSPGDEPPADAAQESTADDAGALIDEQAAATTTGQGVSPPSDAHPTEPPQSASSQTTKSIQSPTQPNRVASDARSRPPLAHTAREVLAAYTFASLLPTLAGLLLAMLIAIGVWASVRRHG